MLQFRMALDREELYSSILKLYHLRFPVSRNSVILIHFKECKFVANQAVTGGAIFGAGSTGVPSNTDYYSVSNCRFESNIVYGIGGAIYSEQRAIITSSTFEKNQASKLISDSGEGIAFFHS